MAMCENDANFFNDSQVTIHGGQFIQNPQNTYVAPSGNGEWIDRDKRTGYN